MECTFLLGCALCLVCCACVVGVLHLCCWAYCACVAGVLHLCWCGVALVLVWCCPCVGVVFPLCWWLHALLVGSTPLLPRSRCNSSWSNPRMARHCWSVFASVLAAGVFCPSPSLLRGLLWQHLVLVLPSPSNMTALRGLAA